MTAAQNYARSLDGRNDGDEIILRARHGQNEWDAWQGVVSELDDLGLSTDTLNSNGTALVRLLERWADRRAALIAFNTAHPFPSQLKGKA